MKCISVESEQQKILFKSIIWNVGAMYPLLSSLWGETPEYRDTQKQE